jgi:hypothetical protein
MSEFISEPIHPMPGSFDAGAMSRGEPGLLASFTWRGEIYQVTQVLEQWITTSPEGGHGEVYLRRHWWRITTDRGVTMKLYCERQAKGKQRWYVYTVVGG